jgi:hypothetical protein
VALVDGTSVSLEDMARRADQGEEFRGYSIGECGSIIVTRLQAPRFVGRDALIEMVLDSGEPIRCTADHVFIRRDGTRAPADELRPGDSLMPLYRESFRGHEMVYQPHQSAVRNHRIRTIRDLPGDHDVYCLTVPEAGNFALEAGVFVANCGIIVNVTPLEPEWEGHVTLEFSNTTPLPAKIYANEGVAQVIFLESDEECQTSYKDRGGKYQGQRGVTLPRT